MKGIPWNPFIYSPLCLDLGVCSSSVCWNNLRKRHYWCMIHAMSQPLVPIALSASQSLFASVLPWQVRKIHLEHWVAVRSPYIPRHIYRMTMIYNKHIVFKHIYIIYNYIYIYNSKSLELEGTNCGPYRPNFPCPSLKELLWPLSFTTLILAPATART